MPAAAATPNHKMQNLADPSKDSPGMAAKRASIMAKLAAAQGLGASGALKASSGNAKVNSAPKATPAKSKVEKVKNLADSNKDSPRTAAKRAEVMAKLAAVQAFAAPAPKKKNFGKLQSVVDVERADSPRTAATRADIAENIAAKKAAAAQPPPVPAAAATPAKSKVEKVKNLGNANHDSPGTAAKRAEIMAKVAAAQAAATPAKSFGKLESVIDGEREDSPRTAATRADIVANVAAKKAAAAASAVKRVQVTAPDKSTPVKQETNKVGSNAGATPAPKKQQKKTKGFGFKFDEPKQKAAVKKTQDATPAKNFGKLESVVDGERQDSPRTAATRADIGDNVAAKKAAAKLKNLAHAHMDSPRTAAKRAEIMAKITAATDAMCDAADAVSNAKAKQNFGKLESVVDGERLDSPRTAVTRAEIEANVAAKKCDERMLKVAAAKAAAAAAAPSGACVSAMAQLDGLRSRTAKLECQSDPNSEPTDDELFEDEADAELRQLKEDCKALRAAVNQQHQR